MNNRFSSTNATFRPSGDQTGFLPLSVRGVTVPSTVSRIRSPSSYSEQTKCLESGDQPPGSSEQSRRAWRPVPSALITVGTSSA
jgi:hypothetical protein